MSVLRCQQSRTAFVWYFVSLSGVWCGSAEPEHKQAVGGWRRCTTSDCQGGDPAFMCNSHTPHHPHANITVYGSTL